MRSCRRLNARNIVFRVIEERRGKKEKKREKKGVKKCIHRYPDYSIHGQSPAFRSDSHDRGMKKRSWKVFRSIVFSFFPTRLEESDFQILFLCSMFRTRNFRNSSIASDEVRSRTSWKLFSFFFVSKRFSNRF